VTSHAETAYACALAHAQIRLRVMAVLTAQDPAVRPSRVLFNLVQVGDNLVYTLYMFTEAHVQTGKSFEMDAQICN